MTISITMNPDSSYVIVEMVVEVKCGIWGPDCTIAQAVSQATRDATNKLNKALGDENDFRVIVADAARVTCVAKKGT